MPLPMEPGVLGIARITQAPRPQSFRRAAIPVPATMETITAPDWAMVRKRFASVRSTWGLIPDDARADAHSVQLLEFASKDGFHFGPRKP